MDPRHTGPDQAVVTGEAVALDLPLAGMPTRLLALLIDLCLEISVLFTLLFIVSLAAIALDPALVAAILLFVFVGVVIGYPAVFETLSRGRTLGKMALGLRVVRDDGGPITFRHALVRALFGFFVDIWVTLGVGALISSLVSGRGKRVGDIFAGTVVVREAVPTAVMGVRQVQAPPMLLGWAYSSEMSALPDQLALAARGYLVRAHELDPAVRERWGQELAAQVAGYVSPPPPPGVSAPDYLSAVLAERSRRAYRPAGP